MFKFLVTAATLGVALVAVGVAPTAHAANESAQFSSLNPGVAVSGSASTTATTATTWFEIDLPRALLATQVWSGTSPSNCAQFGITMTYNGVPQVITYCESINTASFADPAIVALHLVAGAAQVGDVITVSWNSSYTSTIASLVGATVYVWNSSTNVDVAVTPTLSPSSQVTSIPVWQQAIGRASATAPCPEGYTPSWAMWPNNGTGGFVCNKFVPMYGN